MVSSYTAIAQSLDVNEDLTFATNRVITGCTVAHTEGTTTFILKRPGYYYVGFNGTGAINGVAGAVSVELLSNGTNVEGTTASAYSGATTEPVSLSFSTIIKVLPSCNCVDNAASLTIRNTGVASTFNNANITITKIC